MANSSRGKKSPGDTLGEIARALACETPPDAIERLVEYAALIQRWNRRKRIVGSRDPEEVIGVHLADCLAMAARLQRMGGTGQTLIDVGSGAGLPGLAISLLVPTVHVSLCEVSEKRVAFLHHARRVLGAPFDILHEDVHAVAERSVGFDHAVSRAVFEPEQWMEIARRCVHDKGCIWCMLTERQREQFPLDGDDHRYTVGGNRARVLLRVFA